MCIFVFFLDCRNCHLCVTNKVTLLNNIFVSSVQYSQTVPASLLSVPASLLSDN